MTCGYASAYAFTLASFIVIWFSHSNLLNIGRDAIPIAIGIAQHAHGSRIAALPLP